MRSLGPWPLLGVHFGPLADDGDSDEVWLCVKAPGAQFSGADQIALFAPGDLPPHPEQVNR